MTVINKRPLIIMLEYSLGGAEEQFRSLIEHFESIKYVIDVMVLHTAKEGKDFLLEKAKHDYKSIRFHELWLCGKTEVETRWGIYEYIEENNLWSRFSCVLIFTEWILPVTKFFKDRGITTIYSERIDAHHILTNPDYGNYIDFCDYLLSNSLRAKHRIEDYFKRDVRLIHNGKKSVDILDAAEHKRIRDILVPCRIAPIKNLEIVLEMFEKYKDKHSDFMIRFVGEIQVEEYANKLKRYVDENSLWDNVVFTGFTRDMRKEYERTQLVILPSLGEGTPNVVLEAFAYGS